MRTKIPASDISAVEATALSLLFARYVAGHISDTSWSQMMSTLDDGATSLEERLALVNFLNDACIDLGPEAVNVPAVADVDDLVTVLRAA